MQLVYAKSLVLIFALLPFRASAQSNRGTIDGIVVDSDNKVVAGATVYAHPIGVPFVGVVPHSETNDNGYFIIHNLWWGQYHVYGAKEDEDYPNVGRRLYGAGNAEQVFTLAPDQPAQTAAIRLGPKAGVLTGTVTDATTGAPLNPCAEFRRTSDPHSSLTGTGLVKAKFRFLVPSNTDVLLKVWLDGYKPWFYPDTPEESRTSLRLKPAEVQTLDIRLQPDPSQRQTGCGMPVGTVIPR